MAVFMFYIGVFSLIFFVACVISSIIEHYYL